MPDHRGKPSVAQRSGKETLDDHRCTQLLQQCKQAFIGDYERTDAFKPF